MDFDSLFHRFFRPNSGSTRNPFFETDDVMRNETPNNSLEDEFFEDFDHHMNMFQQMEDMFNNIFSSSFGMLGFPKLNDDLPDERSPRSIMMKDPEEKSCDSSSCKKDLRQLDISPYHENGFQLTEEPQFFSYSKFSSTRTVYLPDGTVEEHRTVINNDGNKTTTVHRIIGNRSHEVITKSDDEIKEENFMNLNENELTDFEQKWKMLQNRDLMEPSAPSVSLPTSSPSYWYLIKKLIFGPSERYDMKWC